MGYIRHGLRGEVHEIPQDSVNEDSSAPFGLLQSGTLELHRAHIRDTLSKDPVMRGRCS